MSTIDKAAQVIEGYLSDGVRGNPYCVAQALADAGLLTPDLPTDNAGQAGTTANNVRTLTTLDDYVKAPAGTIIAQDGASTPFFKTRYNDWSRSGKLYTSEEIAERGKPYKALRWGFHS